nr:hypothetical protein [Tanacetum cinerariifolium]
MAFKGNMGNTYWFKLGDELHPDSLHYKETENGILEEGANPYAKGGGEDEDWARNATQFVPKGVDQEVALFYLGLSLCLCVMALIIHALRS